MSGRQPTMKEGRSRAWKQARRLLCVRLDNAGDVLMMTPAIRALKESADDRTVTLLVSPAGAEVAALVPEVDDIIVYDAPWMKSAPPRPDSAPDHRMAASLRAAGFDGAVIFTTYSQSPLPAALLCWLADVPLRLAHCRENPYQLLTDWIPETEPEQWVRHEVRRQLDLVEEVGCTTADVRLSLRVPERARNAALALLAGAGIDLDRPWVVVHPGASALSRRYRPEGFAEAARWLVEEEGVQVVFTGAQHERPLVEDVRGAMGGAPSVSLTGAVDLAGLSAVLSLASLLIANNTGPAHIAAAVGTPVVDLYALTNPQHAPWGVPSRVLYHDVPCRYCYKSVCPQGHHDCLRLVTPEQIVAAAGDLLSARGGKASRRASD